MSDHRTTNFSQLESHIAEPSRWRFDAGRRASALHWAGMALGAAVVVSAIVWVVSYRMMHIQEVDSQGYFLIAKSFANLQWPVWADDFAAYRGHVWVDVGGGNVAAKYPPGWPLLLAAGYRVGGREAAMWVNPICAILAVIVIFWLAKDLFDSLIASVIAFLWVYAPMSLFYSTYPLAHCSEVLFAVTAWWAALRWGRGGRVGWALLAGFAIGFLPLIRPTTALYWPAMLLVPLVAARERDRSGKSVTRWLVDGVRSAFTGRTTEGTLPAVLLPARTATGEAGLAAPAGSGRRNAWWRVSILCFLLAFAVPVGFGAYYNHVNFGAAWHSGYQLTNEQSAFEWGKIPERFAPLFQTREFMLEDFVWAAAFLGILLRRGRRGWAWVIALWVLPTFWIYSAYYYFNPGPVYWRFILPTIPAMIMCVGLPFARSGTGWPLARLAAVLIFFLAMFYFPPRFFLRYEEFTSGKRVSWDIGRDSPFVFLGAGSADRNAAMRAIIREPASVYASDVGLWDSTTYPRVEGFDVNSWWDFHFLGDFNAEACAKLHGGGVMQDPRRHESLHVRYRALGQEGLRKDFLNRIHKQLTDGRQVLILCEPNHPAISLVRSDSTLKINLIHKGGTPPWIWDVTPAPGN